MTSSIPQTLRDEWVNVPLFHGVDPSSMQSEKIGGGRQNVVYRIKCGSADLSVRLAGKNGGRSRAENEQEAHNLAIVSRNCLGPPVLYYGLNTGTLIYPYLPGESLHRNAMPEDESAQAHLPVLIARLHSLEEKFRGKKTPLPLRIRRRQKNFLGRMDTEEDRKSEIFSSLQPVIDWMDKNECHRVPIHADCIPINLMDTGSQNMLIDWQLSGMGDPFYDIGTFLIESELSDNQINHLIELYLRQMERHCLTFWPEINAKWERSILHMVLKSYFWCLSFEQKIQDGLDETSNTKYLKRRLGQVEYLLENDLIKQAFRSVNL